MAALNFPDPNVQTSYTNPDTGIAYEWANGLWKAIRTAQTAPELFVDADGDNLTGNLTLGTDKIVLDATIGSATFTNNVDIKRSTANSDLKLSGSDTHAVWLSNGNFALKYDGSATFTGDVESARINVRNGGLANSAIRTFDASGNQVFRAFGDGGVWIGDASSAGNIQLNSNGTATFAGNISNTGTTLYSNGSADFNNGSIKINGLGSLLVGTTSFQESDANTALFDNGSATFAGSVESENNFFVNAIADDQTCFRTIRNGVNTASINGNGSATFTGGVNAGSTENRLSEAWGFQVYGGPNSSGFALYNSGLHTTNSAQYVVRCNVGGVGDTVDIRTDGSASFAGNVSSNTYNTNQFTIDGQGDVGITNLVYKYQNSNKFTVNNSGTAFFAGPINGTTVGTSDIKFKENIEAAPAQLADIEAFELKTFDWKDEAPISDELKAQRKLGLIAQEVEAICPEMVYEVTGQDDASYKAINHDVLIMKLLGAVKELSDKNTALVERVAALESN